MLIIFHLKFFTTFRALNFSRLAFAQVEPPVDADAHSVEGSKTLQGNLSSSGLNLLTNHLPAQVPVLLDKLPARMRTELDGINPAAHDLSQLRADVILLHGRSDNLIPSSESVALANALPATQVQLFLIDGLAHVDLRPKAHDIPQLLGAMEALLAERTPP